MSDLTRPSAVCLGNFDGVHRGHRFLLSQTVRTAGELGLAPLCYTFEQHPSSVLRTATPLLTLPEERNTLLRECGVQPVVDDFSKICHMEPEEFFEEVLLHRLGAKAILCGDNHRFGRKAAGDTALLRRLCERSGLQLSVISPLCDNGRPISSSWLRECMERGDMETAARLLGRYPSIEGEVIVGRRLGRGMGFPTINQRLSPQRVKPRRGVYAAILSILGRQYMGALNIGIRPTIPGEESAETHILDFDGDLYGQTIKLQLVHHLRDEVRFDSVEALRAQVLADIERVREMGRALLNSSH